MRAIESTVLSHPEEQVLTVCALDLSETLVRFGISDRTELRFVAPDYFDGLTGPNSASGFDDIALGMKQQLGPLPGEVDLAVIVAVSQAVGQAVASSPKRYR